MVPVTDVHAYEAGLDPQTDRELCLVHSTQQQPPKGFYYLRVCATFETVSYSVAQADLYFVEICLRLFHSEIRDELFVALFEANVYSLKLQ